MTTRTEYEPDYSSSGRFDDRRRDYDGRRDDSYQRRDDRGRGYGHDNHSGGYGSSYGNSSGGYGSGGLSKALEPVDFSKLAPIVKDIYKEHEDVAKQTDAEIQAFRREAEMMVQGQNVPKPVTHFHEAGFPSIVLKKLESQGFNKPTGIQAQGWPMAMSGRNMVGIAQTGSGKTLSFILPALLHIAAQPAAKYANGPLALVLAPTRELAIQIQEVARTYGNLLGIRNACVYGGAPREAKPVRCRVPSW